MNPYGYQKNSDNFELALRKENGSYSRYSVQFPSALDTGSPEADTVKGEFFLPKVNSKSPLAIIVHGLGDFSVMPCRLLAGSMIKKGVACFVPYLPVHSKRLPETMQKRMPYLLTPEEWFGMYRVSVVNIRQVLDWAYTTEKIDAEKIFVTGISFGGFVSSITMGIDARIKAGIFIVSGGNQNKISWLSQDAGYRERNPRSKAEHEKIQRAYFEYLDRVSEHGFENAAAGNASFLTDPLTFAGYLKGRPMLMINALNDRYIPREAVFDFWKALGEPPIKWFSSGHASLWLHYPSIRKNILDFLKSVSLVSS